MLVVGSSPALSKYVSWASACFTRSDDERRRESIRKCMPLGMHAAACEQQ